jgi:peptidoglycan hydrolase-like protein with peptidoglycan-binding domain
MSRQKILLTAQSQLNITESPARSNMQKYGDWYGMNGVKWCAIFVSWVYDLAGCRLQVETRKGFHYCHGAYKYWKATGELTKIPQPGDIVLFDWKGDGHCDHTGIFESWKDKSTGRFYAFEGNTEFGNNSDGGKVMRRERSISLVKAFVTPKVLNDTIAVPHSDTLQKGDRGSDVAFFQKLLWQLQYPIDVDGIFGPQTQAAVKQFQQQHFLKVTGTLSPDVLGAMQEELDIRKQSEQKASTASYLQKGNTGAAVKELQLALKKASSKRLKASGVFDQKTETALKKYQKSKGLKVDGIAGPETFSALKLSV